jgi:hypothetical protein
MHSVSEEYKNYTIRQQIAVVAAMIHCILIVPLYGNFRDKIQVLVVNSVDLSNCSGHVVSLLVDQLALVVKQSLNIIKIFVASHSNE